MPAIALPRVFPSILPLTSPSLVSFRFASPHQLLTFMAPKRRPREISSESDDTSSASDTPSPPPKTSRTSLGKRQGQVEASKKRSAPASAKATGNGAGKSLGNTLGKSPGSGKASVAVGSSPFDAEPAWAQKDSRAVNPGRVRELRRGLRRKGPVVYWMSRDQRSRDNWALIYAVQKARERGEPVAVVFNLVDSFLGAKARHFGFMLRGLREVQSSLHALGIPFFLFQGKAEETVPDFLMRCGASLLVTDFSPLRIGRHWREAVCARLAARELSQSGSSSNRRVQRGPAATDRAATIAGAAEVGEVDVDRFNSGGSNEEANKEGTDGREELWDASVGLVGVHEVDAHNVVPIWAASDKLEYAARTIRTKIHRKLPEYLVEYPQVEAGSTVEWAGEKPVPVDWDSLIESVIRAGPEVPEVDWVVPGEAAAAAGLRTFLERRLKGYDSQRNDPSKGPTSLSGLSPWLHYGQIAPQRCALEARKLRKEHSKAVDAFLEELVVRRELADNYCFHQPQYDSLKGAWEWAQTTLEAHRGDSREFVYTAAQWEAAKTHDKLWNAAQLELVHYGKMHGYMRMYWAKKILEWSRTPEEALRIAIEQNDKYSLDGRDPNGYVGCMWSIAGVHDQGWAERKVFGKIRYMNAAGCKRKFDVEAYIGYVSRMVAAVKKKGKAAAAAAAATGSAATSPAATANVATAAAASLRAVQ
ncbi:hypothetical protein CLOM_g9366 [Closterium sp. NIES-68]|nr:hypothetical protein CLOM_g9366 [Closterium sp. NIES-68]GJP73968.1 hypothetical protein CLOP_g4629 [Closterium sp. NIES-67]